MRFLGMGVPELLIILAVCLLIFGPKNLPKLGNALGKTVKSLRKGMEDDDPKDATETVETVKKIEKKTTVASADDLDADIEVTKETTTKTVTK